MKLQKIALPKFPAPSFAKIGPALKAPSIISSTIPAKMIGKFPPDLSSLLGLGFERVSSTKRLVLVRKIEGTDFKGNPHLFTEVEIHKDAVVLRYSLPADHDPRIRHLQSCILLLRVLSLVPNLETGAQGISGVILPALESGSLACNSSYSLLSKKLSDSQHEGGKLQQENRRLRHTCEDEAALAVERERQISVLSERVAFLESVSDAALEELLLDWISSHRGSFSSPLFSKQAGVASARAEEGVELLLKSGALKRIGGKFVSHQPAQRQIFELQKAGIGKSISSLFSKIGAFGPKK